MIKKKNIKGIKLEVIAVAEVFILACILVVGLAGKNILSALTYSKKDISEPVNPVEPNQMYVQTPQIVQQELLTENPVKKVRAIVDNSALINDDNRWYQVGDIVEGQAKIVAIEPSQILVEWNGTQSYVPLDYSLEAAQESQPRQVGTQINNLTEEQRARIQQGLQGLQSLGQIWQNMTPQEREQRRSALQEMGQRFQNMTQEERQNVLQQLGQQWQQWLQTDQSQLPNYSLD